jgi:peptidoglycan/xylan/chitin deacetylase (PgdA/CDA1 family)
MPPSKKSHFIISLDFELMWGVRDKKTIESYGRNILGVREVIPALLDLFDRYDVNATFATVGFLFARNKKELIENNPPALPDYSQEKYSPYKNNYLNAIGDSENDDRYHYAESLIKMIQQHPGQEIASHTYSHYYCLEGASIESFEEDMKAAKKIAASYNIDLKSVVFPRNQYSQQHIDVIRKLGFTSYRGNETSYIYQPRMNDKQSKIIKGIRLSDSYINLTGHHAFDLEQEKGKQIINLPASRFLRPYSQTLKNFNSIRLGRIKNSLSFAARNNLCYHLWWHPHNFGSNLKENLFSLEEILKHYKELKNKFGMVSKSMKEIAAILKQDHAE